MSATRPLHETNLKSLKFLHRGKVRDLYEVDAERMLIIQTDRLSAFDVILPTPIPGKGRVLTAMSNFWFRKLGHVIPNHLLDVAPGDRVVAAAERDQVEGRAFVVRRLETAADRSDRARLHRRLGLEGLPEDADDLRHSAAGRAEGGAAVAAAACSRRRPKPRSARTTKTFPFAEMEKIIEPQPGGTGARQDRSSCIPRPPPMPPTRGIIIADTKFEFGLDDAGKLYLIDEALTPDSSRFWPKDQYRVGISPPSFDKQFVRDWLEAQKWNKQPPAPALPADVLQKTAEKYEEALRLLTRRR